MHERELYERAARILKHALDARLLVLTGRAGLRYIAWCSVEKGCAYAATSNGCVYHVLLTGRAEKALDELEEIYGKLEELRASARAGGYLELKHFKNEAVKFMEGMAKDASVIEFYLEYGGDTVKVRLC